MGRLARPLAADLRRRCMATFHPGLKLFSVCLSAGEQSTDIPWTPEDWSGFGLSWYMHVALDRNFRSGSLSAHWGHRSKEPVRSDCQAWSRMAWDDHALQTLIAGQIYMYVEPACGEVSDAQQRSRGPQSRPIWGRLLRRVVFRHVTRSLFNFDESPQTHVPNIWTMVSRLFLSWHMFGIRLLGWPILVFSNVFRVHH
jgi:hypothetical protein